MNLIKKLYDAIINGASKILPQSNNEFSELVDIEEKDTMKIVRVIFNSRVGRKRIITNHTYTVETDIPDRNKPSHWTWSHLDQTEDLFDLAFTHEYDIHHLRVIGTGEPFIIKKTSQGYFISPISLVKMNMPYKKKTANEFETPSPAAEIKIDEYSKIFKMKMIDKSGKIYYKVGRLNSDYITDYKSERYSRLELTGPYIEWLDDEYDDVILPSHHYGHFAVKKNNEWLIVSNEFKLLHKFKNRPVFSCNMVSHFETIDDKIHKTRLMFIHENKFWLTHYVN